MALGTCHAVVLWSVLFPPQPVVRTGSGILLPFNYSGSSFPGIGNSRREQGEEQRVFYLTGCLSLAVATAGPALADSRARGWQVRFLQTALQALPFLEQEVRLCLALLLGSFCPALSCVGWGTSKVV